MPTSILPRPAVPVSLRDEEIAYVTDNVRDAEALGSKTECPVVLERNIPTVISPRPTVLIRQTLEELETFRRSRRPGVSDVSGVRDVSDVRSVPGVRRTSNVRSVSDVSVTPTPPNIPDVSDVSDVSEIPTSQL